MSEENFIIKKIFEVNKNLSEIEKLIDLNEFYIQLEASLRNGIIYEDYNTNKIVLQYDIRHQYYSDKLINFVLTITKMLCNKITTTSNFSEARILELVKNFSENLTIYFYVKMRDLDLSYEEAKILIEVISNLYEATLRRSLNGEMIKALSKTVKEEVQKIEQQKVI